MIDLWSIDRRRRGCELGRWEWLKGGEMLKHLVWSSISKSYLWNDISSVANIKYVGDDNNISCKIAFPVFGIPFRMLNPSYIYNCRICVLVCPHLHNETTLNIDGCNGGVRHRWYVFPNSNGYAKKSCDIYVLCCTNKSPDLTLFPAWRLGFPSTRLPGPHTEDVTSTTEEIWLWKLHPWQVSINRLMSIYTSLDGVTIGLDMAWCLCL